MVATDSGFAVIGVPASGGVVDALACLFGGVTDSAALFWGGVEESQKECSSPGPNHRIAIIGQEPQDGLTSRFSVDHR